MRSPSFFPSSSSTDSPTFASFPGDRGKLKPKRPPVGPAGGGEPPPPRPLRGECGHGGPASRACEGSETKKGGLPPPFHCGNASGRQAAENIADSHGDQRGDDGLRLDQVTELPRRLLRLAGRLVV